MAIYGCSAGIWGPGKELLLSRSKNQCLSCSVDWGVLEFFGPKKNLGGQDAELGQALQMGKKAGRISGPNSNDSGGHQMTFLLPWAGTQGATQFCPHSHLRQEEQVGSVVAGKRIKPLQLTTH